MNKKRTPHDLLLLRKKKQRSRVRASPQSTSPEEPTDCEVVKAVRVYIKLNRLQAPHDGVKTRMFSIAREVKIRPRKSEAFLKHPSHHCLSRPFVAVLRAAISLVQWLPEQLNHSAQHILYSKAAEPSSTANTQTNVYPRAHPSPLYISECKVRYSPKPIPLMQASVVKRRSNFSFPFHYMSQSQTPSERSTRKIFANPAEQEDKSRSTDSN